MRKVVQVLAVMLILVNVARVGEVAAEEKAEPGSGAPPGPGGTEEQEEAEEEPVLPDESENESQAEAVALDQLELHLLKQKLQMLEQRAQALSDSVI